MLILNLSLEQLAGFSGADLANLLNEGALIAARRRKKVVERIDPDDAREKISFGRERRRVMDDEDRKIIAYHEAGHAIVQAKLTMVYFPSIKLPSFPAVKVWEVQCSLRKKTFSITVSAGCWNQVCCAMGGRAWLKKLAILQVEQLVIFGWPQISLEGGL